MVNPVLVVEDDGLIRMDLADMLADAGFEVLEATNADQALDVLKTEQGIAALLTDIDMPGSMNGVGLANVVAERWPSRKIVIISGRYSPSQGSFPEKARFLSKPVSERLLLAVLKDLQVHP